MSNFWSGRSVFVTGCSGFLGWWLTEALVNQGARVVGLVRDVVPQAPFFADGLQDRITTIRGDVCDEEVIARALNDYDVETVFHLAAQAIVGVANRDPVPTLKINVQGTWALLDACRKSPWVKRVVVASSDKAYGNHENLPYEEDFALQGTHPYDVSKSCADLIAAMYHHTYKTPVCITRCGNLFGPGDMNFSRIVPGTIRSVLQNERPIIRSDGSPMRDYVHVKDIAGAYMALAEAMDDKSIHGEAFNLGTGEPVSVLELTRRILKISGTEHLEPRILNEAKGEILHQYLSSDLARKTFGWRPGAPLNERLAETIEWYRSYLAEPTAVTR